MTAIFSIFGIALSVIIIAIGGGFSGPMPSLTKPPTEADLWRIGQNIKDGTQLNYSLTIIDPVNSLIDSHISINFSADTRDYWKTNFHVINGTVVRDITVLLSKQQLLPNKSVEADLKRYFKPIEDSILYIRDIAREPKYLVIGARWDTILLVSSSVDIKVIGKETINTSVGNLDSYIIGYKVGPKTSRIWLTHKVPLPIKAEVYNPDGKLWYKYSLNGIKL
jgi:hypothetical protein